MPRSGRHVRRTNLAPVAQRGAALVVAMMFLVVIALVGVVAIREEVVRNRSADHEYDRQLAFQSSEDALRQGEAVILTITAMQAAPAGFEDCSTPYGSSTPISVCLADPFADENAPADQVVTLPATSGSAAVAQTQFFIQYMGKFRVPKQMATQSGERGVYGESSQEDWADFYRVTARSGNPVRIGERSTVTLQSMIRKSVSKASRVSWRELANP